MIAEVPDALAPACELFSASGYVQEALLTDYVWQEEDRHNDAPRVDGTFVIPVTVDDLAANGLFAEADPSTPPRNVRAAGVPGQVCWEHSVETLTARKDEITGLAVASDERIEAYLLYLTSEEGTPEIVSLRSFIDDRGARLGQLLSRIRAQGMSTIRFRKVHSAEFTNGFLEAFGFRPAGVHRLYTARARSN
jgi:hypothetical protein